MYERKTQVRFWNCSFLKKIESMTLLVSIVVKISNENSLQEDREWSVSAKTSASETWLQLGIISSLNLKIQFGNKSQKKIVIEEF